METLSTRVFLKVLLKNLSHGQEPHPLVNYCERHGDSPLHVAASQGNNQIIKVSCYLIVIENNYN